MEKGKIIDKKEIRKITRKIAELYGPEKIILFGSFAWGKPNQDSDVDLLIIKETEEDFFGRNTAVRKIILIRTPEEIKKRLLLGDFFYKNIIKKGKNLYVR